MTVRVIAIESCSASHLLPVSRKRNLKGIELLHEGPQLQLRVGLQFTLKWNEINHTRKGIRRILRGCFRRYVSRKY